MGAVQHIVNVSGGKDSTAVYLLAMESGRPFRAVHCDTGHEHPITEEYVRTLHERTGGPRVEIIRADFTSDFVRKRGYIEKHWAAKGVPSGRIERALQLLAKPTGVPFLDLCIMKGRFPSTKARFCTEELKVVPKNRLVLAALKAGPVLSWVGVRSDESRARANARRYEREDTGAYVWRPVLRWTAEQVFAKHDEHGVEPNPLYRLGMGRVGCMPCIMARKAEIGEIARRWPEEINRVAEWETLVADASRSGRATFFAADKTTDQPVDGVYPSVRRVADWAQTSRGGKQYDLEAAMPVAECSSVYGLCE